MTITREQVADLQPGDVVEMSWSVGDGEITLRGPLVAGSSKLLSVAGYWVRKPDGAPIQGLDHGGRRTLTVVSRAPRPLYVNHPRTEPVPGDVVRTSRGFVYSCTTTPSWVGSPEHGCETPWRSTRHGGYDAGPVRDNGLRLLVDGETGQVVP